jgi:hypothetical protein
VAATAKRFEGTHISSSSPGGLFDLSLFFFFFFYEGSYEGLHPTNTHMGIPKLASDRSKSDFRTLYLDYPISPDLRSQGARRQFHETPIWLKSFYLKTLPHLPYCSKKRRVYKMNKCSAWFFLLKDKFYELGRDCWGSAAADPKAEIEKMSRNLRKKVPSSHYTSEK